MSDLRTGPASARRPPLARWILAGLLLALAVGMPTGWYDRLPRPLDGLRTPPVRGVDLLRLAIAVDAAVVLSLGLLRARARRLAPQDRLPLEPPPPAQGPGAGFILLLITLVAALLRFHGLGSDLWLDEITTVIAYRDVSPLAVVASYPSSNNQIVNTLSIQAAMALFGEKEWAIRLFAALCGVAAVPALYLLARQVLRPRHALLAAGLLATSYHHVFFSQNARGYSTHLLGSLLATAFFLRGLREDRTRDWALYALSMWIAILSHLTAAFVAMGHVLTVPLIVLLQRRARRPVAPLLTRLAMVWAGLGLLAFHAYASALPWVLVYVEGIYQRPAVGYALLSIEYLRELIRGVSQGLGAGGSLAAVGLALAGAVAGLAALRRHPLFTWTLAAPLVATTLALLVRDLRFSPRFFLWSIPVAFTLLVEGAAALGAFLARRRGLGGARFLPGVATGLLVALSLSSLGAYYRTPKQPSREVVARAAREARPGDAIVAAYLAKWAFLFYGQRYGLAEGSGFDIVHTREELEAVERAHPAGRVVVVTTFPRALAIDHPDLDGYIRRRYREGEALPATIGDGSFTVWRR